MAEVIELSGRQAKERRRKKARADRRAAAIAAAMSCGLCPRRCAHCGLALEGAPVLVPEVPYPFCQPCAEELEAFRRYRQGDQDKEAFWHTDDWSRMWQSWLDHMGAMETFRRSGEFFRLMQEHED